ncbi:MAG TPA: redoxin domain-containing protein [Longimicrobiales bacterium]|nr:redoxin domain-containing protein [Longimicrobiales bacterium]
MMSWKRALSAAAIVLPLLALLAFGLTRNPNVIPSPLPGREAPQFELLTLPLAEGGTPETVDLAALRGNVVVLNFWASWCLACRDEHAPLSRVARAYADEGVQFFGIVYDDSPRNARQWIEAMGGQAYPALLDPHSRTAIDYGLYGVPETFVIGPDGTVRHKIIGPATEQELRAQIDALLLERREIELPAGGEHPVTETI